MTVFSGPTLKHRQQFLLSSGQTVGAGAYHAAVSLKGNSQLSFRAYSFIACDGSRAVRSMLDTATQKASDGHPLGESDRDLAWARSFPDALLGDFREAI